MMEEQILDNLDENKIEDQDSIVKRHHGFTAFWIVVMILLTTVNAILYFNTMSEFENKLIARSVAFLNILNIYLLGLVYSFRKVGFYGYLISKLIIIIFYVSVGYYMIIGNVVGLFFFYVILGLENKVNNKSSWSQMD